LFINLITNDRSPPGIKESVLNVLTKMVTSMYYADIIARRFVKLEMHFSSTSEFLALSFSDPILISLSRKQKTFKVLLNSLRR
jgi:hypothetical protein